MSNKTILRSRFTVVKGNIRIKVEMGLRNITGNKAPYFYLTVTDRRVLDWIPELEKVWVLNLSWEDGHPFYETENFQYFVEQILKTTGDERAKAVKSACLHARINKVELEKLLVRLVSPEIEAAHLVSGVEKSALMSSIIKDFLASLFPRWEREAKEAKEVLQKYMKHDQETIFLTEDDDDDDEEEEGPNPYEEELIWFGGDAEPMLIRDSASGWSDTVYVDVGLRYLLAPDEETAEKATREYWEGMIHNDPTEFAAIVGEKRLAQWALGKPDAFGISSAEEFLDKVSLDYDSELGRYDGSHEMVLVSIEFAQQWWSVDEEDAPDGWVEVMAFRQ